MDALSEPRQADAPVAHVSLRPARSALPAAVDAHLWRGSQLGSRVEAVVSTGFAALDRELPGGGWPCRSLIEILQAQPAVLEWRVLAPALRTVVTRGDPVVVIGPPRHPHLPGLRHAGLDERHFLWIPADSPAERLWCTEQLIKSNACGAIVSWLSQARPEQIRRLQVLAQSFEGPAFLCRPAAAQHEASAAPLRILAALGTDWSLALHIIKRRGPVHDGVVCLDAVPGGLSSILTPRLASPSRLLASREVAANALGSTAPSSRRRRLATAA